MILIEKWNNLSRVVSFDTKVEEADFKAALRFKVPNAFWTRQYQFGWDGTYSFFNRKTKTFPTGLLDILPPALQQRLEVMDRRFVPRQNNVILNMRGLHDMVFRDYQTETISKAVELERCAIESPTGSGKTEIGIGLTFVLAVRTLFCVHLENLLWQAKERFEGRGFRVGVINASTWSPSTVTIAMVPTLYSRLQAGEEYVKDYLKNEVDCLILDECHHLGSASSWELPAKYCNAYYRFGLSATTMLKDDLSNARLIGQTGRVIMAVEKKELIERGIIAQPIITMVCNETLFRDFDNYPWQEAYHRAIEDNEARNLLICRIASEKMDEGKPVLIIVHTIRHAEQLMMKFSDRNLGRVRLITGAVDGQDRQELIKRLDSGEIKGIVATPVFDEGADIPNLRVLVLGGGGKSPIKVIQRMGRGMRRKVEGDNTVEIFDFLDSKNKYTRRHAQQRMKVYAGEGFDLGKAYL